ncbi:hypothetical protein MKW92_041415, partial [Papaver armeniacum]
MASNGGESGGTVNDGSKVFEISSSSSVKIRRGDITKWPINGTSDAIVNAANERMLLGGGVDGGKHASPQLNKGSASGSAKKWVELNLKDVDPQTFIGMSCKE